MTEIHYVRSWFIAKKRPTDLLTLEQAQLAHAKRERHTVVVGALMNPIAFINLYERGVGVSFLDRLLRVYLVYSFQEVESDRLFLTMSTYREFDGASDKAKRGTSYIFEQDGHVLIRERELPDGPLKMSGRIADVSGNWDRYPDFGEYDSLLRVERPPAAIAK